MRLLRLLFSLLVAALVTYLGACILALVLYSQINPLVTGVQVQRQIEAWASGEAYDRRYDPVGGDHLSSHLMHAVVAAEDARFYQHAGLDVEAIRKAYEEAQREGASPRGASTITQQLVKNLFMTTHRSWIRKGLEVPLALLAELILSKKRILELYLNVIEWGHGIYGAEAAAQHYYGTSAGALGRWQSAAMASVIPAPRTRTTSSDGWYTNIILQRMNTMGY